MTADAIARLKITLDHVKPALLRRVEVPFDIRLDRLHQTIQAAMEAMNDPQHERHAEFAGWIDENDFDPTAVDVEQLTRQVAGLASYWTPKPAIRRTRHR